MIEENNKITPLPLTYEQLLAETAALKEKLRLAEKTLQAGELQLNRLTKDLKAGLWEWNEITNEAIYYSEEFANIYGLSLSDLTEQYKSIDDFSKSVHPHDLQFYMKSMVIDYDADLKGPEGSSCEYRIIRPNGEVRYVRETEHVSINPEGVIDRSYGVLQDITEFKRTLKALKQSEEIYSSLFLNLPLGLQEEDYSFAKRGVDRLIEQGVIDLETYFIENPEHLLELVKGIRSTKVNKAQLKFHGATSASEFFEEEENVDSWWSQSWILAYASSIATLAAGIEEYHEAEWVDSRLDGSRIETRSITAIVKGYEQTWERIITIHEDISDRKSIEADLIQAKKMAEDANQAKSQFLSSMSHELRTPLNAILGFSQLFEYDPSMNSQQRSNALEINRAGKHLMSLVDDVLDLSQVESGRISVSMEPLSLEGIIEDSLLWVSDMANSRQIEIVFNTAPFIDVLVNSDVIRLKQIFLNLLTNAIKYNQQGGSIAIIGERCEGGSYSIGIRDTGAGLSPAKQSELFQPFNRLGAELSSIQGTGIGLLITKQLIELMGGQIWVDSAPGKGSTFWIKLVEVAPTEPTLDLSIDSLALEASLRTEQEPKILVAEDNLINQELIKAQLKVIGFSADYAENGVEALAHWRGGQYDILLTDIRMPEMDGYELITKIREEDKIRQKDSVVIAISANALDEDIRRCLAVGANEVIAKPVELEQLRSAIEKLNPKSDLVDFDVTERIDELEPITKPDIPQTMESSNRLVQSIDFLVLEQSVGSDVEIHQQLLSAFADELPIAIKSMRKAVAWGYQTRLSDAAHKLKSSSRSLGAINLGDVCDQLEIAANDNAWTEIKDLMEKLELHQTNAASFIEDFCHIPIKITRPQKQNPIIDVPASDLSVLVVDDDYIIHRVTTVILNDLGISRVKNALSGALALDIVKQDIEAVDIVMCDINMPDMDGIELMRHLAKVHFSGAIIITSGEDVRILRTVEKLAIEHELQVLGVLPKPVMPAKVYEMLEILEHSKSEGTLIKGEGVSVIELKQAIHSDQIVTYFQPKVDIKTAHISGMEVLVRWEHPKKGLIMPGVFVPMAEENNLIKELTRIVCKKAMQQSASLQSEGFDLNIAINISVDTLNDLNWPDEMVRQIESAGISASSITFEITESRLMEHISVALDILSRLSLKRFNLSIDDFGTGYSSMEQLQRIPFSELKIDRAFVSGATHDKSALAILESSVLLAKKLDMKVVAEGVEKQEEWDLMAELGCDQIQGYFVSRPMPFDVVGDWLRQWQLDHS